MQTIYMCLVIYSKLLPIYRMESPGRKWKDVERGQELLANHFPECGSCDTIPGAEMVGNCMGTIYEGTNVFVFL